MIFCEQCEEELTEAEIKNANDLPELDKEAFTDGKIHICPECYRKGHDEWIYESMQPSDSMEYDEIQ